MSYRRIPSTRTIIKTHVDLCKKSGHEPICDEHLDGIEQSLRRQRELIDEAKRREIAERN